MFVENVVGAENSQGGAAWIGSCVWLHDLNDPTRIAGDALYHSALTGSFKFLGGFADRELMTRSLSPQLCWGD